ncbi:MAG: molecular chaperone DnaK [Pseudomonadota bacterium]
MARIIGIDLGTSNSAAAVVLHGTPTIIPSAEGTTLGGKAFPSYVAFTKQGERLVGEPARRQTVSNPEGTVTAIKRLMGTNQTVTLHGRTFTPQQISAFILQKVKADSESFLGETVDETVITVPAYFNDNQRQATKDAGTIAGLEVVRIINEPTAAALAFGIDKAETEQKIMVFDLGGGTLDVTLMEFGGGVFEVLSTSGDTRLGGTDMDDRLVDFLADEFNREFGMNIRGDRMAIQRLREAAEKAKIELSSTLSTEVNLPYLTADAAGPKHFTHTLSRARLEQLAQPIIDQCRGPVERALGDAKLTAARIDRIIMVGGPTRMPAVQRFVEDLVGKKIERGIDPMECVAIGAAIQAGVLAGEVKEVVLLDVTPLSLGIETLGGVSTKLIERNTTIPTRASQVFTTAEDNQTAVEVHVLQGERAMARDNVTLGRFHLNNIPPAPRGVPQIEVGFDIDANGILNVSAKDMGTGRSHKITITATTKLPPEELDRMVKEADRYTAEDRATKERVVVQNQADSLVYLAEKTLRDLGDKVNEADRRNMNGRLAELRETMKGQNVDFMRSRMESVNRLLHEISSRAYQQAGPGPEQPPPGAERRPGADETIEAEFEEK